MSLGKHYTKTEWKKVKAEYMYEQINTHTSISNKLTCWCQSGACQQGERERKDKFTLEQNVTNDHINVNT